MRYDWGRAMKERRLHREGREAGPPVSQLSNTAKEHFHIRQT